MNLIWKDAADFSNDFALDWGMTTETRNDLTSRLNAFLQTIAAAVEELGSGKYTSTKTPAQLIRGFESEVNE